MLQIYSKVFNMESILPGNELSTDRHRSAGQWLPTTVLSNLQVLSELSYYYRSKRTTTVLSDQAITSLMAMRTMKNEWCIAPRPTDRLLER